MRINRGKAHGSIRHGNRFHRLHRKRHRHDAIQFRHVEVFEAGAAGDDGVVRTSRRIRERTIQCAESSTAAGQETRLITAADCRLTRSEPRNLPGKSDSRTEVVEVFRPRLEIRIGRTRSHECQLREIAALARPHPVLETASGISEQCGAAADRRCRQTIRNPRYAVIIPSQAEIQREVTLDFPVVFEEDGHFVLIQLADALNGRAVIGEFVQLLGRSEPVELGDLAQ